LKRTISVSRNSQKNKHSLLGLVQLILVDIEEKLRSILKAEEDEVAEQNANLRSKNDNIKLQYAT